MENCELCGSTEAIASYSQAQLCGTCRSALDTKDFSDTHHWRCLNEAIWSESTPVKILSYRILSTLQAQPWALELKEQIFLDPADLAVAQEGLEEESDEGDVSTTRDSNGALLQDGDSVTLIKDLEVKGANFTAKRGTLVKGIRLTNNPEHVDAKVNGIQIVLVSKFLKKV